MFIRKTILLSLSSLVFLITAVGPVLNLQPQVLASSHIPAGCPGGPAGPPAPGTVCPGDGCGKDDEGCKTDPDCNEDDLTPENCGILDILLKLINALSALVGVVIVALIVVGGIQYSAAGDNPQSTAAAKKRIMNAIIALIMFVFMTAFLQWLIPGGVLN